MGRGRAKAKQAKVARQLKYSGADTDLEALRKELAGGSNTSASAVGVESTFSDDDLDDEYDEYDDDDGDEDDDDPEDDRSYGAGSRR
jgi:hypothetical protein